MIISQMFEIIRNRCANSPVLTADYIVSMWRYLFNDISIKTKIFKSSADISGVSNTFKYVLPQTLITIDRIEMGQTITDPTVTVKLEPQTYSITWETDTNGHANVPHLNLKFNPGTDTIRVWYNNFRNYGTLTVTDETIDMDDTFNPIIQNLLLDGVIWMYKLEWERNPAGQLSKDLYDEGCALLASVYNADITYL